MNNQRNLLCLFNSNAFFCIMIKLKSFVTLIALLSINTVKAIPSKVWNMAPPHWYVGFSNPVLEIIVNASEISAAQVFMKDYEGVEFIGKKQSANRHIAYLQVKIAADAKPGFLEFYSNVQSSWNRIRGIRNFRLRYELKARATKNVLPYKTSDVLYEILVDRFSNGNTKNDVIPSSKPQDMVNIDLDKARHGGDLQGVINKLPYLNHLGITAINLSPIQNNKQKKNTYTGRLITNHFSIDERFGNQNTLDELILQSQKYGIKVNMELLPSSFSHKHWMHNYFDTGWFSNETAPSNFITSSTTLRINERNAHMITYANQVALWWADSFSFSGFKIELGNKLNKKYTQQLHELMQQNFPELKIYGMVHTGNSIQQACYAANNLVQFKDNTLKTVTDYTFFEACNFALSEGYGNGQGFRELHQIFENDLLYQYPEQLNTFVDCDFSNRIFSEVGGDIDKWEMAMMLLFTTRGIPSIYYGTELLLDGGKESFYVDFPADLERGASSIALLDAYPKEKKEAFEYLKNLIHLRRNNPAIFNGKTVSYRSRDNTFVYFRMDAFSKFMIVLNQDSKSKIIDLNPFVAQISDQDTLINMLDGSQLNFLAKIPQPLDSSTISQKAPFQLKLSPNSAHIYKVQ